MAKRGVHLEILESTTHWQYTCPARIYAGKQVRNSYQEKLSYNARVESSSVKFSWKSRNHIDVEVCRPATPKRENQLRAYIENSPKLNRRLGLNIELSNPSVFLQKMLNIQSSQSAVIDHLDTNPLDRHFYPQNHHQNVHRNPSFSALHQSKTVISIVNAAEVQLQIRTK